MADDEVIGLWNIAVFLLKKYELQQTRTLDGQADVVNQAMCSIRTAIGCFARNTKAINDGLSSRE